MIISIIIIYLLIGLLLMYISIKVRRKYDNFKLKFNINFIIKVVLFDLFYPIIFAKIWLDDYIDRNF